MKGICLAILSILFYTSCSQTNDKPKGKAEAITLFLVHPKLNRMVKLANGASPGIGKAGEELSIIDSLHLFKPIAIDYEPADDTIQIKCNRRMVSVNFRYKAFDEFDFLFESGDSVMVTFDSGYPVPKIVNRLPKAWDYDFERYTKQSIYRHDYSSLQKELFSFFLFPPDKPLVLVQKELKASAKTELGLELGLLDSLKKSNLISAKWYAFYKERATFRLEMVELLTTNKYVRPAWSLNEELMDYHFYRNYLFMLAERNVENEVPRVISKSSNIVDYRVAFDRLIASQEFTLHEKEILLTFYMEAVITSFSNKDIERYFAVYSKVVTGKGLVEHIKFAFNLDFKLSAELHLQNAAHEKTTFKEILQKMKGDVVYVDFWASWCAPCVASMPASRELRKEYENRHVSFIYLSRDTDFERWVKSANKHKVNKSNSFMIDNQFTSQLMDELAVTSIPRYLLFDRNGMLVHKNAPGPGTDEIKALFDSYLK